MEPFIGEIHLFPYSFTPQNWAPCEGQLMDIMQNNALFALLGTEFGGDGLATFALPDLRGKEPHPHVRYYIATFGLFPARE